jgi:hypothetical protein
MLPVLRPAEHSVGAVVVDSIGGRLFLSFRQVGIAVRAGAVADAGSALHAYAHGSLPLVGFDGARQH